jgi:hypothetical protein
MEGGGDQLTHTVNSPIEIHGVPKTTVAARAGAWRAQ